MERSLRAVLRVLIERLIGRISGSRVATRWVAYLAAMAVSGLAVLVRLAMDPIWGNSKAYLTVFPAVILATWFGGRGPGFLATLLCVLGVDYFWARPTMSFSHKSAADVLALIAFVALGFFVSHLHATVQEQRERARAQTARAEQERKAREELMAIVAHDLRSPLQTILMSSRVLRTKIPDASPLGVIERSVSRMDHLIQDLLIARQLEAGELRLTLAPEDATRLVADAADTALPLAQGRGIELRQEAGFAGGRVTCDRERVLQVFGNLIGNALKFTPEGGAIVVRSTATESGLVAFEVKDTGRGIASEDLPHIFERHWKRDPKGTGLGLYIASGIVRAHGGQISAQSEPGIGTTIRFTLPRADSTSPRPSATLNLAHTGERAGEKARLERDLS